jgi:hypothetical protein
MLVDKVEKKLVRATVYTTSQTKLEGCLFVPSAVRLMDELNANHCHFIAVAEATLTSRDGSADSTPGIMLLNKHQIVCVLLRDEQPPSDEAWGTESVIKCSPYRES